MSKRTPAATRQKTVPMSKITEALRFIEESCGSLRASLEALDPKMRVPVPPTASRVRTKTKSPETEIYIPTVCGGKVKGQCQ